MKNLITRWKALPYSQRHDILQIPFKLIFLGAVLFGVWNLI